MRPRGTGCLFRQPNSPYWWISYSKNGRRFRESSKTANRREAERLLARRLGELNTGAFIEPKAERVRYEELAQDLLTYYSTNGRKSVVELRKGDHKGERYVPGEPHLRKFFAGWRAVDITTDKVRSFVHKRQEERASNATINRSLSALKFMFSLAKRAGKVRDVPYIEMLEERNVRKGFLEHDQYLCLRDALPAYMKPVLAMGYYTGMRLGEILHLRWGQVNFFDRQVQLNPGETKNDEPRIVPLTGELFEALKQQKALRDSQHADCSWVFFRGARRIGSFRKVWANACVKAALGQWVCRNCDTVGRPCPACSKAKRRTSYRYEGLIFHDLRRTGVRNLVRAGVPELVAMAISGHRSRSIFDRYNIVSGRDLDEAALKLDRYLADREKSHSSVIPDGSQDTAAVAKPM